MVFFLEDLDGYMDRKETPNDGRPPADKLVNEFFFDGKCARKEKHSIFYKWCYEKKVGARVKSECQGVGGSQGICTFAAEFRLNKNRRFLFLENVTSPSSILPNQTKYPTAPNLNATTPTPTITTTPKPNLEEPRAFYFEHNCPFGSPGKDVRWNDTILFKEGEFDKIWIYCKQELYGTSGWPLWLIILAVLLVIAAVSISAALFWKYWLRRKVYGRQPGEPRSTIGSHYTSAPYSTSSALGSRTSSSRMPSTSKAGSASRVPSGSRMPSGSRVPSASRSVSGSRVPSMRSGSVSRMPTARSGSVSRAPSGSRMPSSSSSQSSQRSKR